VLNIALTIYQQDPVGHAFSNAKTLSWCVSLADARHFRDA
jgi:hypothetical protein